jgi:dihydrofolate reductase
MKIKSRLSISADGYVTTPSGWPALTADPAFASGSSHGIAQFLEGCEQALMGSVTFAPAVTNDRWPWPDLDVFVLGSTRPEGTPDHVVFEHDPATLLDRLRAANRGGDVHLVGGPKTIETFRALGALDELHLVVLPLLLGDGGRLTPSLSPEAGLTFVRSTPLPEGTVEIVYEIAAGATNTVPGRDAGWTPASQRPSDAR